MADGKIESAEAQRAFVLAGNAIFTVHNPLTGGRYTFKVRQPAPEKPHFVSVLTGPENTRGYTPMGRLESLRPDSWGNVHYKYLHNKTSRLREGCPAEVAFGWAWQRLEAGRTVAPAEFFHTGRCGRCGRLLTTPESVARGIGPECAAKGAR